jgi:imidazolonepropionase-like amidohydrolase
MHAHTMLPGDGTPFAEWMALPDELLLLKAQANAMVALQTGVTTIRDCGGRGTLMFRLREAIQAGITTGPRFVLCGRALTITGGHCHYFGGEADGPDEMRRAARQLLKEGADFIKIMASGGGTVGTYPQFRAFDVDELSAAIAEAHKFRKPASCHCTATESIPPALEAGTDHIEHCMFMNPDLSIRYDEAIGQQVAAARVAVTATIQVMAGVPAPVQERYDRGEASAEERQMVTRVRETTAHQIANIGLLHELGVPIVAGNDAGWRTTGFGDFYRELRYLTQAGLSPLEAIHAATGRAAEACRLGGVIGTVAAGAVADLLAVRGDPLGDLGVLKQPALVLQSGRVVVDRR